MTLIEVLVTLAILTLVSGLVILGSGAASGARLKRGTTQVAGAVRIAYAHATATSKTVRLVFDFEERKIALEEADGLHLLKKEISGGAEAATELELLSQEAAAHVIEGPQAPRATFTPVKALGFPIEGKELPTGITFWQVETGHQEEPIGEGRAYLYFFPGGQTENAAVQVRVTNSEESDEASYMTVIVAPLTGKTKIHRGRVTMPAPRDETEASEREDTGS
jgi:general secretion pathway protein H